MISPIPGPVSTALGAANLLEAVAEHRNKRFAIAGLLLTARGIEVMRQERAAFLSLARTQKRLSWGYRRNALEAKAAGDREGFLRNAAEARRLWQDAHAHLQFARNRNF